MNLVPAARAGAGAERNTLPPPPTPDSALDADLQVRTPAAQTANESHPLEARLRGWQDSQQSLQMETLRRVYGAGEPIRRAMEQMIVAESSFSPLCMDPPSNLHLDILQNRDATITWEDVHRDEPALTFHQELEARMFK